MTVLKDVFFNPLVERWSGFKSMQVDTIVLNVPPESFDVYLVYGSTFSIHTDLYFIVFEYFSEYIGSKLTALIRVENVGFGVTTQYLFQNFEAWEKITVNS